MTKTKPEDYEWIQKQTGSPKSAGLSTDVLVAGAVDAATKKYDALHDVSKQLAVNLGESLNIIIQGGSARCGGCGHNIKATPSSVCNYCLEQPTLKPFVKEQAEVDDAIENAKSILPYLLTKLKAMKLSWAVSQEKAQADAKEYKGITAASIKAGVEKLKNSMDSPLIVHPAMAKDLENFYNGKFLETLKSKTPIIATIGQYADYSGTPFGDDDDDEDEVYSNSSGAGDNQKFLQRIGMMSNCNVTLQGKFMGSTRSTIYRLVCDQCKGTEPIESTDAVVQQNHNHPEIVNFCKLHQHLIEAAPSSVAVGRRFRDESS